jgi:hypothetical protein
MTIGMPSPAFEHFATSLVAVLDTATRRRDGQRRARSKLGEALRAALAKAGGSIPIGDGDHKTGAPGTYRPVGLTCPPCPYSTSCYALNDRVGRAQIRSPKAIAPALRGAIGAMTWGALTDRPTRIHVSGDLGQTWADARPYVAGLIAAINAVSDRFGPVNAWGYTHLPRTSEGEALVALMAAAGLHFRWSDHVGVNGAIVVPFNGVPALQARTGLKLAKCPAQLRDVYCKSCRLCWERPDLTIVFAPHGARAAAAASASPAI